MSREIDALVAAHVFGLAVQDEWLPAWTTEGDWLVHPEWRGREDVVRHPVYVDACMHEGYRDEMVARVRRLQAAHGWSDADTAEHIAQDDEQWACGHYWQCFDVVPHYSTDIGDAWRVVEKMHERGWLLDLHVPTNEPWGDRMKYKAHFAHYEVDNERGDKHGISYDDDSAPLAICLAALKAHGITPPGAA